VTDEQGESTVTGTRVLVAVLTYRRPDDLAAVLPLLREQAAALDPPGRVLVVDNDPDAGARGLVEGAGGDVTYAHEPTPGIAAARNRALDETGDADVVVFIDDDERPVGDWLALLLATYHVDRPTGVVGPVVSEFSSALEPWVEAGRFFDRRRLPTGTVVEIAATNNLLLDLAQLRALDLRFDERFGLSGGSDMLITRQLTARGGRLVWCDEAVVTDVVPAERLTREWVLRRAYRSGNTTARTSLVVARGPADRVRVRARLVAEGSVRLAGGAARLAVGTVTGSLSQRVRGRRTWARGAGMLAGVTGAVYVEYSRDGRRHVRAGTASSA
jgi:glycosyltransferase involved in cell wall biosynthesis